MLLIGIYIGFEPQLTFQQRDILAFEGSAFTFGFVAYGAPAPVYTYSLNNHTLQLTGILLLLIELSCLYILFFDRLFET